MRHMSESTQWSPNIDNLSLRPSPLPLYLYTPALTRSVSIISVELYSHHHQVCLHDPYIFCHQPSIIPLLR